MTEDDTLRLLVLGGTAEGNALARALMGVAGLEVTSSLAGRTIAPRVPPGKVRVGGFGGAAGLAAYLREHGVGAVVDATHPFAAIMGKNAAEACSATGVPLLRLERPLWRPGEGDRWTEVASWEEAARELARTARHVLLAIGRHELAPFAGLDDLWFLIRSVEAPQPMPPFRHAELLLARGPFAPEDERTLLSAHRIDTVVCKNSGGKAAEGKLLAARALGLAVVMRKRPPRPALPTVGTIAEAVAWLSALRAP